MFKERFHGANAYVEMNEGLDSSMLASLGRRRRRRLMTAISLVLALLVLAPWAASTPAVFLWINRAAPPVAHFLRPSEGIAEENGIRMEAVAVTRQDDTLLIELTLEDLEGDRLNKQTRPEFWVCSQGDSSATGRCTPRYDEETGLLHLTLTCEPMRNIKDFDWDHWITIHVSSLLTLMDQVSTRIPIPLTLGEGLDHTIRDDLAVTSITASDGELRVRVQDGQHSGDWNYQLRLTGPHGEQVHLERHEEHADHIDWVFALRDRDLSKCTLTAWVDPLERIRGPWQIDVTVLTSP